METNNNTPYLSYSRISLLAKSPKLFHKKYILNEEIINNKTSVNLGSALDALLTEPNTFYDKFAVITEKKPTGQLENFITKLLEIRKFTPESFEEAYNYTKLLNGGKLKYTINSFIERFQIEGKKYYDCIINSENKIILSFEELLKCQEAVNSLKTNKFTSKYLSDSLSYNEDIIILNQYSLESTSIYGNYTFKGIIDKIIIDTKNKTIQGIDLKTTSKSTYSFDSTIYTYRYDIQCIIYQSFLEEFLHENYPNFELLPFKFIVINLDNPSNPLVWEISDKSYTLIYNSLVEIILNFEWHLENNMWDYPKYIYNKNGIITTNIDEAKITKK
jgi:hypothetical protein